MDRIIFSGKTFAITGMAGREKKKIEKRIVEEGGILVRGASDYHIFGTGVSMDKDSITMTPDVFWYLLGEDTDIKKVAAFFLRYQGEWNVSAESIWEEILSDSNRYMLLAMSEDNVSAMEKFVSLKTAETMEQIEKGYASPYSMIHKTDCFIEKASEMGSTEITAWLLNYKGNTFTEEILSEAADDLLDKEAGFRDLYMNERFERVKMGNMDILPDGDDEIFMGIYPQKEDGTIEPIKWKVLDRKDGKALLLSEKGLDCRAFHSIRDYSGWEGSDIRKWLNGKFIESAFSIEEQMTICESEMRNDRNKEHWTKSGSGEHTLDKVFILSMQEAEEYMPAKEDRICHATDYAKKMGAWADKDMSCWWWLRTAGYYGFDAVISHHDGALYAIGYHVTEINTAVRPAMWVDIENLI